MKSKKELILDVALSLFLEKGFDHTSINDILKETKIARGTLYYHFESKESIMDAIIERASQQIIQHLEEITNHSGLNAQEKLFILFAGMKMQNLSGGQQMIDYLNQPQNALFHEKSNRMIIEKISPLLSNIILQGIQEKLFENDFPLESAEILLITLNEFLDTAFLSRQRIQAFIYIMERILGAKPSSLVSFAGLAENNK